MGDRGQTKSATGDGDSLNKFTNLCSELECALANIHTALDEVLALKDVILEHNLPSAMKVKLTLSVGRLHRSISDMSVPTGEMTRLVRLYAVPWENKSKALKKLHQDYESKQHKLEIALRRLELIGVQAMRMEKERRIMNWEKLFAKLIGGKGHGQRWRFFIYQFKQKLKKGEDISTFYSAMSDDESSNDNDDEADDEGVTKSKRNILFAQELREKLKRFDGLGQSLLTNKEGGQGSEDIKVGRNSIIEEESEASIVFGTSDDNASTMGAETETPVSIQQSKKKVRFDRDAELQEEKEGENEERLPIIPQVAKEMSDKVCWTHEPDYDSFFNIRLYEPKCKTLKSSWCTVVFDNEVRRSQVFDGKKEEDVDAKEKQADQKNKAKVHSDVGKTVEKKPRIGSSKETVRTENSGVDVKGRELECRDAFQEFSFKLPEDFSGKNKEEIILKFSIHPANKKKMIAMTTIKLSDVVIADEIANGSALTDNEIKPTSYHIKSTVNNSELTFNKKCGEIHILCFYSKVIVPLTISRGTETLSIEELTNRIMELRKKELLKRLKSAGTSMTERPIYTEEQMHYAKEELKAQLKALKEEYEERLSLMISQLNKENLEDLREFVNAATSPLFMWSESNEAELENGLNAGVSMEPVKPSRTNSPKKSLKQTSEKKRKVWGQNVPEDFYERMEMFKEESSKYHQNLKEKVKDEVGKEIEKTLASNNRLDKSSTDTKVPDDVCLPALYMPTKTRNLYTPKARSYFHAFGTNKERLTQAPSILELPRIKHDNNDIVGIYETVMREKLENMHDHENDTDLGRFSPESSTSIEITGLENNEEVDER